MNVKNIPLGLKKVPCPSFFWEWMQKEGSKWVQIFENYPFKLILSLDVNSHGELLHMSLSNIDRYPTWDEIIECKEYFFGDVDCMMVMPKKRDYVNISKHCFHVWQTPTEWGEM